MTTVNPAIVDEGVEPETPLPEAFYELSPLEWPQLRVRRVGPQRRPVAINKKGGSGKTTTTVQLAAAFARWSLDVRITDGDPQMASATFWLPPRAEQGWPTLLELFMNEDQSLAEVTAPTAIPGIRIVPSLDTLARVELERPVGTDTLMIEQFEEAGNDGADVELMDAPPSMGTVTVSLLVAATDVLLTLKASTLDFVATAELRRPLATVKRRLNPELEVSAVVLVATDEATIIHRTLTDAIDAEYPQAIVHSVPHSVRAVEAPGVHQALIDYAPGNPVTLAYWRLAAALVEDWGWEWEVGPDDVIAAR